MRKNNPPYPKDSRETVPPKEGTVLNLFEYSHNLSGLFDPFRPSSPLPTHLERLQGGGGGGFFTVAIFEILYYG